MKRLGKMLLFHFIGENEEHKNGGNNLRRKTGSEEKESYQDQGSGTRNVINKGAGKRSLELPFPTGEYSHFLRSNIPQTSQ